MDRNMKKQAIAILFGAIVTKRYFRSSRQTIP